MINHIAQVTIKILRNKDSLRISFYGKGLAYFVKKSSSKPRKNYFSFVFKTNYPFVRFC